MFFLIKNYFVSKTITHTVYTQQYINKPVSLSRKFILIALKLIKSNPTLILNTEFELKLKIR